MWEKLQLLANHETKKKSPLLYEWVIQFFLRRTNNSNDNNLKFFSGTEKMVTAIFLKLNTL